MKKLKFLIFALVTLMSLGVMNVNAEVYSDEFKKITTDGKLTINAVKPQSKEDADFLLTGVINDLVKVDDVNIVGVYAGGCDDDLVNCKAAIHFTNPDDEMSPIVEEHSIQVIYNEPNESIQAKVNSVINKMRVFENTAENPFTLERGYILEDLYLINYLNTAKEAGLWNNESSSLALKFAKELIDLTNGSNITFKMDTRAGQVMDIYQFSFGQAIIYYNGIIFTTKNAAITLSNVIYIPEETEESKEAYINAAKARIDAYLGAGKATINYGGLQSSLVAENFDNDLMDYDTTDGNYYNIKIGKETFKFLIVKKETSKLETPKFVGTDILSDVSVKSNAATIPLDTILNIKKVNSDLIQNLLNTDNYLAYDFSLYSNNQQANIKKLENGLFQVEIPVNDTGLEGKTIVVYYLTTDNKLEEHTAVVKDGYAIFETDHFSIYIVAEKLSVKDEENPLTFDGLNGYLILGTISLIGLAGTSIYIRKRFN